MPKSGSIVRFKKHLFLYCRIHGEITRLDKNDKPTEKRPKIRVIRLVTLSEKGQYNLNFDGGDED
jgi:hypothetical protein